MDCVYGKSISREEQMIRDELEHEIENDLEEEIKDNLSMLARRLQILHQRKKKRNNNINDAAATAPDLCIVIKLGISCDIHIKDGNGSLYDDGSSRPYTPYSEPCLKKSNPDRCSISTGRFGSLKNSLAMSKSNSISCTSRPSRKRSKNGKAVWKY